MNPKKEAQIGDFEESFKERPFGYHVYNLLERGNSVIAGPFWTRGATLYNEEDDMIPLRDDQIEEAWELHRLYADNGGFFARITNNGEKGSPEFKVDFILPKNAPSPLNQKKFDYIIL